MPRSDIIVIRTCKHVPPCTARRPVWKSSGAESRVRDAAGCLHTTHARETVAGGSVGPPKNTNNGARLRKWRRRRRLGPFRTVDRFVVYVVEWLRKRTHTHTHTHIVYAADVLRRRPIITARVLVADKNTEHTTRDEISEKMSKKIDSNTDRILRRKKK